MEPYREAVELIWKTINVTPSMHQNDFERVVQLFDRTLESGKRARSSNEIADYMKAKGSGDYMADKLATVYEVPVAQYDCRTMPLWAADAIAHLVKPD